jgi:hypothetical protein
MTEHLMKNFGSFADDLVSDPKNPPELTLLQGWLGASSEAKHRRLYLDAELSNSLEIPEDAILRTQALPADHNPLGSVCVWVRADAAIKQGPKLERAYTRFLCGQIQADNLNALAGLGGVKTGIGTVGVTGIIGMWTAIPLSFVPTALNDNGVIVGNHATLGPVRFENGAMTVLPPLSGVSGTFAAVDVASNSAIVGSTGDSHFPGTFWLSGGVQLPIGPAPVGLFVPKAMNVHLAVVGGAPDAGVAFKWTANALGFTTLEPPPLPSGSFLITATDINDAGSTVGFAIKTPSGPAHIILWSPSGAPTLLDNLNSSFSNPHILNNGAVYWMNGGSIIRRLGGTSTFEQPPGVDSFDAVSQAGRLAGTMTVNGVRRGWTSHHGNVTFLDLPNAQPDHFFRPVAVNSCGNNIIGVHQGPNGAIVEGVLFARQLLTVFDCDTPPVLNTTFILNP